MEEQLRLLIELQEVDTRIRAHTEQKNRLPESLAALERRRTANKEGLDQVRESLLAAQKRKRDRDLDLEAGAQKIEKLKTRSAEIKNNKEYQAMLKEIEAAEKENKAIEDDILVLMEKIDAAAAAITGAEKHAHEEEAAIRTEQAAAEAASAQLDEALTSEGKSRSEAAARIDAALLAQYQKLLASRTGIVVVEARGESCSGCYMSIPPQVFVNVKKNESIISCPHCSRILYFKG